MKEPARGRRHLERATQRMPARQRVVRLGEVRRARRPSGGGVAPCERGSGVAWNAPRAHPGGAVHGDQQRGAVAAGGRVRCPGGGAGNVRSGTATLCGGQFVDGRGGLRLIL